ncbi:MAG: NUDIX domain-containing protein [Bacteroidota bacterium]
MKLPVELHIVAAILINRSGKVLIARKKSGLSNEGLFEFPGGKAEEGESFNEALYRELHEELGILVAVPDTPVLDYIHRTNTGQDLHFHIF